MILKNQYLVENSFLNTISSIQEEYMWEIIERLLEERGLNKNQLARQAGLHQNSLIDLKMGRKKSLKFEDVVKIADTLGVSLDEFR